MCTGASNGRSVLFTQYFYTFFLYYYKEWRKNERNSHLCVYEMLLEQVDVEEMRWKLNALERNALRDMLLWDPFILFHGITKWNVYFRNGIGLDWVFYTFKMGLYTKSGPFFSQTTYTLILSLNLWTPNERTSQGRDKRWKDITSDVHCIFSITT